MRKIIFIVLSLIFAAGLATPASAFQFGFHFDQNGNSAITFGFPAQQGGNQYYEPQPNNQYYQEQPRYEQQRRPQSNRWNNGGNRERSINCSRNITYDSYMRVYRDQRSGLLCN